VWSAMAASELALASRPSVFLRAGQGEEGSQRGTYLSMTTAGVWVAIVADVLLLRAAPSLGFAQQAQHATSWGKAERPAWSRQATRGGMRYGVEVQDYVSGAAQCGIHSRGLCAKKREPRQAPTAVVKTRLRKRCQETT
jgi:hypothetical protein